MKYPLGAPLAKSLVRTAKKFLRGMWQVLQSSNSPCTSWYWLLAGLVWQSSQAAVVGMWLADLPVAVTPLWQLAHEPITAE